MPNLPKSKCVHLIKKMEQDFLKETGRTIKIIFTTPLDTKTKYSIKYLVELVAAFYDTTREEIFVKRRRQEKVVRRYIIYYLCMANGYSCVELEREFGYDHTTILFGRDSVVRLLEYEKFKQELRNLSNFRISFTKKFEKKYGSSKSA